MEIDSLIKRKIADANRESYGPLIESVPFNRALGQLADALEGRDPTHAATLATFAQSIVKACDTGDPDIAQLFSGRGSPTLLAAREAAEAVGIASHYEPWGYLLRTAEDIAEASKVNAANVASRERDLRAEQEARRRADESAKAALLADQKRKRATHDALAALRGDA